MYLDTPLIRQALAALALSGALVCDAAVADQPLAELPYTPGLDVGAMDASVDPCVDFYRYACGGWLGNNPIPADRQTWNVYGKLHAANQRFLWGILAELAGQTAGRSAGQQQIGDFFAACSDEPTAERLGATPLQPTLARIDAMRSRRDLPRLLAALQLIWPARVNWHKCVFCGLAHGCSAQVWFAPDGERDARSL
jgi:putative endopeptidase